MALASFVMFVAPLAAREATGTVGYSPTSQTVEGPTPSTDIFEVTITAPGDLTQSSIVSIDVTATDVPSGFTKPQALGFVTVSPSTLNFSSAGQSLKVTVTVALPRLISTEDLSFVYLLTAVGWKGTILGNPGTVINVTATSTVPASSPPIVSIETPSNGAVFTYSGSQLPTSLPLKFRAISEPGVEITSWDATLNGSALDLSVIQNSDRSVADVTATLPIPAFGTYTVQARATNINGTGEKNHQFTVNLGVPPPLFGKAIVRHAPALNGQAGVDGSLQVLLPENIALDGAAWISGKLYVPGTPSVRLHGHPTFGGVTDGTGSAAPSNHTVTLNGNALLGQLVRRTEAVAMPGVPPPPTASGTRNVKLNRPSDNPGDFRTIRDLTVSGNLAPVAVPPGTYRDLTVSGNSGLVLGVAGVTNPSIYNVRSLKFSGNSTLTLVGPVILTVANSATFEARVGNPAHPEWLDLRLASGGLTLNGAAALYGRVLAPAGTVRIDGQSVLRGGLSCDRLSMGGYGLLDLLQE